jgi:hypothetical protein
MRWKGTAAFVLLAFSLLFALPAQQVGAVVGWYNGEWRSGIPGPPNWYANANSFIRVYDEFQVPDSGWTVVGAFSDNGFPEPRTIVNAFWEIRRGMAPGNGGEIVASGVTPVVQGPDPSVTPGRYPAAEIPKHFRIEVDNLHVQLPPGHYWLSVTPVSEDKFHVSATLGANAVGLDRTGIGMALVDRPDGPRFAILESTGRSGQSGRAQHCAQGVIIAK